MNATELLMLGILLLFGTTIVAFLSVLSAREQQLSRQLSFEIAAGREHALFSNEFVRQVQNTEVLASIFGSNEPDFWRDSEAVNTTFS